MRLPAAIRSALLVTTSPVAAREWMESEEAASDGAQLFSKICKTMREAEYRVQTLQNS